MSEQILKNIINTLKYTYKEFVDNKLLAEQYQKDLYKIITNADAPISILVMGEFSTGKSTFINALVGKEIAAVGALPTTAVITKLSYGDKDITVVYFRDGKSKIYKQKEFEQLTAETKDEEAKKIRESIKYVERKLPINILKYINFIDSPGLNGLYEIHTNTTKEFADNADAVLWMFSADKAVSSTEMAAMESLNPRLKPFAIINQIDKLDPEEDDIEEFLTDIKNKLKGKVQGVIGISSLMALKGKLNLDNELLKESNFNALKEIIETKVIPNRAQYKLNSLSDELGKWIWNIQANIESLIEKTSYINEKQSKKDNYKKYSIMEIEVNIQKIVHIIKEYSFEYSNLNNASAMFMNGILFYYGCTVEKNRKKAINIFETVALSGHYIAQTILSIIYCEICEFKKSFYWTNRALENVVNENDKKILEYILGIYYQFGYGINKNENEAIKWYTKAAEQGYAEAQNKLAECYFNGIGITKNEEVSVKWYTKAAEQGYAEAQNKLAECYFNGIGITKNEEVSVKWYTKAAEQGYAEAQNKLAECYFNGTGINKNIKEAIKWYKEAAEKGYAIAQNNLANCYFNGIGINKNISEAVKWYERAAEQGHVIAQNMIGRCYDQGWGISKNTEKAVKWYTKAAEQGYAVAQNNLADHYFNGIGIIKSETEAVKWYTKAAEQGYIEAKFNLATCLLNGIGAYQNKVAAFNLFYEVANYGISKGEYWLGECYQNGYGTYKNLEEAIRWYNKAAEQDNIEALCSLGISYLNGIGVEKDISLGIRYLKESAERGLDKAQYTLGEYYYSNIAGNYIEAINLIEQAEKQGYIEAKYFLGIHRCYSDDYQTKSSGLALLKEAAAKGYEPAKKELILIKEKEKKKYLTPSEKGEALGDQGCVGGCLSGCLTFLGIIFIICIIASLLH